MKSSIRLLFIACTALSAIAFSLAVGAEQTSSSASAKAARQPLEKEMSAETIRQIIGAPTEIQPIKAPDGVAEKWIYRRVLNQRTRSMNVASLPVTCHYMSPDWSDIPGAHREGITIRQIETTTNYQVTALLMFNNKLVVARQWQEAAVSYSR